jgi:hypothetical protein
MRRYAMVQFDLENLLIHTSLQRGEGGSKNHHEPFQRFTKKPLKRLFKLKMALLQPPR